MSWHYLLGLEAESWAGPCLDGAPGVLSKLIPTVDPSYSPDSGMECCPASQSGTMSAHSTGLHGEDRSMSSAEDFRAKTLARPEKVKGSAESDPAFGLRWPELSLRYDRDSSSWKIHPCLFPGDWTASCQTLPVWGLMRCGELSERTTWELITKGIGSGSWPTPRCQMTRPVRMRTDRKNANLEEVVAERNATTIAAQVGGLNPTWVEWLMGWPLGWTDLRPLETDTNS